jgi:hypothetical protein
VSGDGVFEFAHASAEGAACLGKALGAEEQQQDEEQDRNVGWGE